MINYIKEEILKLPTIFFSESDINLNSDFLLNSDKTLKNYLDELCEKGYIRVDEIYKCNKCNNEIKILETLERYCPKCDIIINNSDLKYDKVYTRLFDSDGKFINREDF